MIWSIVMLDLDSETIKNLIDILYNNIVGPINNGASYNEGIYFSFIDTLLDAEPIDSVAYYFHFSVIHSNSPNLLDEMVNILWTKLNQHPEQLNFTLIIWSITDLLRNCRRINNQNIISVAAEAGINHIFRRIFEDIRLKLSEILHMQATNNPDVQHPTISAPHYSSSVGNTSFFSTDNGVNVKPTPYLAPEPAQTLNANSDDIGKLIAEIESLAKQANIKNLADVLPDNCIDPVHLDLITDPVELPNGKVIDRETLDGMVESGRTLACPLTRDKFSLNDIKNQDTNLKKAELVNRYQSAIEKLKEIIKEGNLPKSNKMEISSNNNNKPDTDTGKGPNRLTR